MTVIHSSRSSTEIPSVDLLTYVFGAGDEASRSRPQYFDAFNPSRHYSLNQAQALAKRVGLGLQQLGLRPDDKVLLCSENSLFFPVLLWGTIAASCVFTASSPSATVHELAYQLQDSDARVLLTSLAALPKAVEAAAKAGLSKEAVFVFGDPDALTKQDLQSLQPWTSFWAAEEAVSNWHWWTSTNKTALESTTVIINYSSGTTGTPKGVEITHANIIANSTQLQQIRTSVANTARAHERAARLASSHERWIAPLPMYHAYGQLYYSFNAPRFGAKVFVMHKYDIQTLLLFLDIYRITSFNAVPVMLVQMLKQDPAKFNLQSIEFAGSGSAPLGADIGALVASRFFRPGVSVRQGFGMTELTCSLTGFSNDDAHDGRSVGFLFPNCKGKIVPLAELEWTGTAPDGVLVGELWVAGGNVMKGYYKRPQQTAETIVLEDGIRWLRTGDVAYFDHEGRIFIVDRLKELIKVKGLQVAPAELEAAILEHEAVVDAAVVGAKLHDGEHPRAFVVRKPSSTLTESTVEDIVSSRFARHKWLTGGVYFVSEIPRTPSGKVVRRRLPDPTARGVGSGSSKL